MLFRIAGEMTSVPSWLCKRQEVLASLHLWGKREWDQAEFYKLLFFSRLFKNLFCTRAALTALPLWYGVVLRKEAMTKGGWYFISKALSTAPQKLLLPSCLPANLSVLGCKAQSSFGGCFIVLHLSQKRLPSSEVFDKNVVGDRTELHGFQVATPEIS